MKNNIFKNFESIWFVDYEFISMNGNLPSVICMVARELYSNKVLRLWKEEIEKIKFPPYSCDKNSLFIAYYSSAELGCHLVLNWHLPVNVLDLCIEFKNLTNGIELYYDPEIKKKLDKSLIGALLYFGQNTIGYNEKEYMRNLILNGGPWSKNEKEAILDYCESDVLGLSKLFSKMIDKIDISRALLRGEYMKAVAIIENNGISIDYQSYKELTDRWDDIQFNLINEIDKSYNVYQGKTFKIEKWKKWVNDNNIDWPLLDSGQLDLKDEVFRHMSKLHPNISPMRELRHTISQMRLNKLTIGDDQRNRCLLSAFGSKTSRNQPSNQRSIFGSSVWLRSLIKPKINHAIAYIDWSQQEFGIAGALSGDINMLKAYESGDPYLKFAKQAGRVPEDGTKESHNNERERFKQCALGVLYGMGEKTLGLKVGNSIIAKELLIFHKNTYPKFWQWSEDVVNYALLKGNLQTVFGWSIKISSSIKIGTIRNFLMQANGAEMMRLACIYILKSGIKLCMPVHDAFLIESTIKDIQEAVRITQNALQNASKEVLNGFELRSESKIVLYPERYIDPRGKRMWDIVETILRCSDLKQGVYKECTPV